MSNTLNRRTAMRLLAAHDDDSGVQVERLLSSEDAAVGTAALLHLVSRPGTTSEELIAERVELLLRNGTAADRLAVALALAVRPRPSALHPVLRRLLDDPDPDVRRAAIGACGKVGLREFVPALVPLLGQAVTREAARAALAAYGDRVVGTVGDYLDDPSVPLAVRRELPRVLARIGTQAAVGELAWMPHTDDAMLRLRLLQAQVIGRMKASSFIVSRFVFTIRLVFGRCEREIRAIFGRSLVVQRRDGTIAPPARSSSSTNRRRGRM